MNRFKVIRNICRCHPETCCCDDWVLIDTQKNNEVYCTFFKKEIAEEIADLKNKE